MFAFIPVWVYFLLAGLLALGFMQSRSRRVAPAVVATVSAALAGYSLWGVLWAFGADALALALWAAGMAAMLVWGASRVAGQGLRFDTATRRVLVPGSWLPMLSMMGIFVVKFGLGMAAGMGRPVAGGTLAAAACALALGLLSGSFAARARRIVAVARQGRRQGDSANPAATIGA